MSIYFTHQTESRITNEGMVMNIKDISDRIKRYRIDFSMTQTELSDRSGVSVRSISRFENGEDISLSNFIKLIDALELGSRMDELIPDYRKRPSYYLETEKKRQRATTKNKVEEKRFVWGDEK